MPLTKRRDVVAIKHFVNCEPQDIAIDRRDTMEFVILAVPPNAFVDFREMRDHSFDERLRKVAHARGGRAEFPEIPDFLRPFAVLKITPEMILDGRFSRFSPLSHKTYSSRSFDMTRAIPTAARAASVPRLILFSRQRSRACVSFSKLSTTLMTGTP